MKRVMYSLVAVLMAAVAAMAQTPMNGGEWKDNNGKHINAHGGNIIQYKGLYYWIGEARNADGGSSVGARCYTSKNLKDWTDRGIVLSTSQTLEADVEAGWLMERPKIVYCPKTQKFLLWFHLELKGKGYAAARYGVAEANNPLGPYKYLHSGRVNPGQYPIGFSLPDTTDLKHQILFEEMQQWWTPEWRTQIERGMFFQRDAKGGQMARDMTIFIDDDGKAYHIYSSEENLTLQIAQLTDDYSAHNGTFVRVAPGGQNEAPTVFKKDGVYWMITSGCTGWAPNKARMFTAKNILGPWKQLPNPCVGDGADKTFGAQGTYILQLTDAKMQKQFGAEYVFMADIWKPKTLSDSRHLWIPIAFENGAPVLKKKTDL